MGAAAAVMVAVTDCAGRLRRVVRRWNRARRRRQLRGQGVARGRLYRRLGLRPVADVDDNTLADRVRSTLGPIEKRLDLPRIHVSVTAGVATLHGDVTDRDDARRLELATAATPGVRAVCSQLHEGLLPSDSRPSQGRLAAGRSHTLQRLLDAAREAGACDDEQAERLAGAVLSCIAERLPAAERGHFLGHLPLDARHLAISRSGWFTDVGHIRDVHQFVLAVAASAQSPNLALVEAAIAKVLGVARSLVPEEAADVAAVLPGPLRHLWSDPASLLETGAGEVFLGR